MSTHCEISALCGDGKWRKIYVHYDGYPEHTLKTLLGHYSRQEMIDLLMFDGGISFLNPDLNKLERLTSDPALVADSFATLPHVGVSFVGYGYKWNGSKWRQYTPKP